MQTLHNPQDELVAWLDEQHPVPSEHTVPAWPGNSGEHCDVCRERKRAAFSYLYSSSPVPGRAEEHATAALTGTGRFCATSTVALTRR